MSIFDIKIEKKEIPMTIAQRNRAFAKTLKLILENELFLLLGHTYSDEDCVASMIALSLLLRKFDKEPMIFLPKPLKSQLGFFMDICSYNKITCFVGSFPKTRKPDAVFILDTPKPDMIAASGYAIECLNDTSIPKIEIDHHFTSDAAYTGDKEYRLTLRASSTCEILALMCYKLNKNTSVLKEYEISDLYSRNIVLAILTGMIGDAKLGNYLFKRRDKSMYNYFLGKLNKMLSEKFYRNSENIGSVEEILQMIETLSVSDKKIYSAIMKNVNYIDNIGTVILDEEVSKTIINPQDYAQFVELVKKATDSVAEHVSGPGMSIYFEPSEISNMIQCRIRASEKVQGIDFRPVIKNLNIKDGGGHPGAVAFRVSKLDIKDFQEFISSIIQEIKKVYDEHTKASI